MMKKYMPNDILEAQKQGFSSPDASWFKGKSISFVKKKLTDKNANIYNFMDYKSVHEILSLHFNGKENRRLFIWSLLNFNEYLNHNFVKFFKKKCLNKIFSSLVHKDLLEKI